MTVVTAVVELVMSIFVLPVTKGEFSLDSNVLTSSMSGMFDAVAT